MQDSTSVINCDGLTKVFGTGHTEVRAVDGISLAVHKGELALIMGPSGSGKTTLLSMLGALLRPTSGVIELSGREVTALPERALPEIRASTVGFVFQAFNLLDALTVEENVLFPARLAPGGIRAARPRAQVLLERLGLMPRRNALPHTLSGGEKQRVAIARALINLPPLILADEPTGNLDSQKGQEVLMILHDIARDEGCAVLIVTHDSRAVDIADRVLWLEDGKLHDRRQESHAWQRDLVCGMRVDLWTAEHTLEHKGVHLVFCSAPCRGRFLTEPERYKDRWPEVAQPRG